MNQYNENFVEPPVEAVIEIPKVDPLKFDGNNPYDNVDDAYTLALQLNEELKVHDAVLALQAHLTKEPDHAASWRLLGQLYQEKDEDDKAIHYFMRAYELDPYDCDSLLCLGVSCTNELDEKVAMTHLMDWLRYNPEYCDLPIPQEPIQDVDEFREQLKGIFNLALTKNPDDIEVMV
jgi:tetratricopeptide (TPR) repeat protein